MGLLAGDTLRIRDVRLHPERPPLYDAVLVDEGQDLDANAFETLAAVSRHVTVAPLLYLARDAAVPALPRAPSRRSTSPPTSSR